MKRLERRIRRLLWPAPNTSHDEWSIGIYGGASPFDFVLPDNVDNPVLTRKSISDVPARFVADPFMLKAGSIWYMFFEVMNSDTGKGEIGLAVSEDGLRWAYKQIVLAEAFSLSYPYVFEWMNDYYMIPESRTTNSIRLYKASRFPTQWSFVGALVSGRSFVDASVFLHGKWWLFAETNPGVRHDTLRLYGANDLLGPWYEHPKSPIINGNPHIARPAGRVLVVADTIIRYAQDCHPGYGTQVRAFEITELTTTSYREREVSASPILRPSGTGWNKSGMHHIDAHLVDGRRWMACVDGRLST